jgi:ABC-type phosphate transport system substrate-binding protein
MARAITMLLVLVLPCAAVLAQANAPPPVAYRVIVHPRNPVHAVDRSLLADAFLKKVTRWRHGEAIRPVDLAESAPRRKFSEDVLGRSVAAVRSYWQQQIFSGRGIPPPELDGDQAVVKFVLQNEGAVGYVSGHAEVGTAKVLAVR